MVSKVIKKTPTKTLKDRRSHHRRKKSPIKNPAATVSSVLVASINTCHRRLIKIFSKLARINNTPLKKKKSPKKQGYQILPKTLVGDEPRRNLFSDRRLPPPTSPEKRTVFLDLDETLVHSKPDPPPEKYDFVVRPVIDGVRVNFYVLKRPCVDELLEFLTQKFEVVVFTAGLEEYASLVLDRLDRSGSIAHRLYRSSCREVDGKFVKDLAETGRDLKKVVIVDDNPNSYSLQPDNAIPISPFTGELPGDEELRRLMEFFDGSDGYEDMREAVKVYLTGGKGEDRLLL
ncbi:Phosphoprotein phosphatase [Bertholletia excelsa]